MPFRRETALAIVLSIAFVFIAVGARTGIPGFSGDADAQPPSTPVQTQTANPLQSLPPTEPVYSEQYDDQRWEDDEDRNDNDHEDWDDDEYHGDDYDDHEEYEDDDD